MAASALLVPARPDDVRTGERLAYALYDRDGSLIAPLGYAVRDDATRQRLLDARPYRKAGGIERDAPKASAGEAGPAEASQADPLGALRHNVESVQLVFRLPGDPDKRTASVQFCGRLGRQALIVSAPHLTGPYSWHHHDGLPMAVRMTSGRTAYAFDSVLLRFAALPAPHMMLRYPDEVRLGAFREAVRLQTALPAVARLADGQHRSVVIADLSGSGCAVDADEPLGEIGSRFELVFRVRLSQESYTLNVPVTVRNLPRARGRVRHGVSFGDEMGRLDWHLRLAVKAFIYESLLEG